MKINNIFNLNKTQYELDFIDIDIEKDITLFLDPYFLSNRNDRWSINATRTIQSFFKYLIDLLRAGKIEDARTLFNYLHEPNETRLGLSKGKPQGRSVGTENTESIFNNLIHSKAIETGLIEDIEDSAIFVEDIGKDKISDMTTNIIRKHLIEYTQNQCNLWKIPLTNNAPSNFFWDETNRKWDNIHTQRLIINDEPLLLVPKGIVSYYKAYTDQKYHRHFVLNFLQNENLRLRTILVKQIKRKDGRIIREYVTKKDVVKNGAPPSKKYLREFTAKHPEIFIKFRNEMKNKITSLSNEEFDNIRITDLIEYLLSILKNIKSGTGNANNYHNLIIGILELILYPNLINPIKERELHEGRKRIDITFDNAAETGIFHRLHNIHHIPCPYLFVECKNYDGDPSNPELDQLSGRFSPNKGKVGLLLCRQISNLDLFIKRCQDTYNDDRGLIIPITDNDIILVLQELSKGNNNTLEILLTERIRTITLN